MKTIKENYKGFEITYKYSYVSGFWEAWVRKFKCKGTRQEEYYSDYLPDLFVKTIKEAKLEVHKHVDNLGKINYQTSGMSRATWLPDCKNSVKVKSYKRGR